MKDTGSAMVEFMADLYPICRSITGNGVRETLHKVNEILPIEIVEVPTGELVFDWEIPREWNITDGYIKDPGGNKILDFKKLNLHVLNYSMPVSGHFSLEELKKHIHTIPEKPDLVPYRTSYYKENWGFCMSHNQFRTLEEGEYEVLIDSSLTSGSLTYGEVLIEGKIREEILISTHICHPSLCNDNLSGIAVSAFLGNMLKSREPHYSYRFIFIPGTIGAITWLSQNESKLGRIRCGIVTALLGLGERFTYKRTRSGDGYIDKVFEFILKKEGVLHDIIDFTPYGYDERQFSSPGINLPVGSLSRIPYGQYHEYHTSGDNMDLISGKALTESFDILDKVIAHLDADRRYLNLSPKGEPQLGKRGLYDNVGGRNDSQLFQMALLWVLNFSDGNHSLTDIAIRSDIAIELIIEASEKLAEKGLLKLLN